MARVRGLQHFFGVLDSREASFQLVKRLWPNSAIQNESSFYRKSAGMAGSIISVALEVEPIPLTSQTKVAMESSSA